MSVTERPSRAKSAYAKSTFQIPAPSENVLLAVIAAAFLVLHIAAGVILINASAIPTSTTQEEAGPSLHD